MSTSLSKRTHLSGKSAFLRKILSGVVATLLATIIWSYLSPTLPDPSNFWGLVSTILSGSIPVSTSISITPVPGSGSELFPETGKRVNGLFLRYWQEHGGLQANGYPISDEIAEVSATNNKLYTVQYFERTVLEYHPENQPSYAVLPSLLGVSEYRKRYGYAGAPNQSTSVDNPLFFPETSHTLGGKFRATWEQQGGLSRFGYPISDEFYEQSRLDDNRYLVQYFERAEFEWHQENAGTDYEVLVTRLGILHYQLLYP